MSVTHAESDFVIELAKTMQEFVEIMTSRNRELALAIAKADRRIKELNDRVEDLEGHAEHGPDGTCGVCAAEGSDDGPETVSADEYATSDFNGYCAGLGCTNMINVGDSIVQTKRGWKHRDCS